MFTAAARNTGNPDGEIIRMKNARLPTRLASSTLVVGSVLGFLAVASLIGFVDDASAPLGTGWSLRGSLVPAAEASASRLARPALQGPKNPV